MANTNASEKGFHVCGNSSEANHSTVYAHVACVRELCDCIIMRFIVLNSRENWNFAGVLDIYLRRMLSKLVAVWAHRFLSKSCPYIKAAMPIESYFCLVKVSILLLISFRGTSTWITIRNWRENSAAPQLFARRLSTSLRFVACLKNAASFTYVLRRALHAYMEMPKWNWIGETCANRCLMLDGYNYKENVILAANARDKRIMIVCALVCVYLYSQVRELAPTRQSKLGLPLLGILSMLIRLS